MDFGAALRAKSAACHQEPAFKAGELMQVTGIKNKPDYNGKTVRILKFHSEVDRYEVQFEGGCHDAVIVKLRKENLTRPEGEIPNGTRVDILGLQSEAARWLNGQKGVVLQWDKDTERYEVHLDVNNDVKKVKAANVRRLPRQGSSGTVAEKDLEIERLKLDAEHRELELKLQLLEAKQQLAEKKREDSHSDRSRGTLIEQELEIERLKLDAQRRELDLKMQLLDAKQQLADKKTDTAPAPTPTLGGKTKTEEKEEAEMQAGKYLTMSTVKRGMGVRVTDSKSRLQASCRISGLNCDNERLELLNKPGVVVKIDPSDDTAMVNWAALGKMGYIPVDCLVKCDAARSNNDDDAGIPDLLRLLAGGVDALDAPHRHYVPSEGFHLHSDLKSITVDASKKRATCVAEVKATVFTEEVVTQSQPCEFLVKVGDINKAIVIGVTSVLPNGYSRLLLGDSGFRGSIGAMFARQVGGVVMHDGSPVGPAPRLSIGDVIGLRVQDGKIFMIKNGTAFTDFQSTGPIRFAVSLCEPGQTASIIDSSSGLAQESRGRGSRPSEDDESPGLEGLLRHLAAAFSGTSRDHLELSRATYSPEKGWHFYDKLRSILVDDTRKVAQCKQSRDATVVTEEVFDAEGSHTFAVKVCCASGSDPAPGPIAIGIVDDDPTGFSTHVIGHAAFKGCIGAMCFPGHGRMVKAGEVVGTAPGVGDGDVVSIHVHNGSCEWSLNGVKFHGCTVLGKFRFGVSLLRKGQSVEIHSAQAQPLEWQETLHCITEQLTELVKTKCGEAASDGRRRVELDWWDLLQQVEPMPLQKFIIQEPGSRRPARLDREGQYRCQLADADALLKALFLAQNPDLSPMAKTLVRLAAKEVVDAIVPHAEKRLKDLKGLKISSQREINLAGWFIVTW